MITSLTNPKIKNIVKLRDRGHRKETGLTVVDGIREMARALNAGTVFTEIYYAPELLPASEAATLLSSAGGDVQVFETSKDVFRKIAYENNAKGMVGVARPAVRTLAELPKKEHPLYLVVESVEKPGNLGAILRTCDGAGVDGVIICDGKTDLYNPNVIRSSLGTVFTVPTVIGSNEETLQFLKVNKVKICAATLQADQSYTDIDGTSGIAVVVGSEMDGLSDFWRTRADIQVKIPMKGSVDSLNVSASTAVLLYEIGRQRKR